MPDVKLNQDLVIKALSKVDEPELHRDLVSLHMVRDIQIECSRVAFTILLTTPACPLRSRIEAEARQAVMALPGVEKVEIKMESNVPNDGRPNGVLSLDVKNVIAVASGKGGVGKSTLAVNIAIALKKTGASVGLMDADIYGPNVPTMMGVHQLPAAKGDKLVPAESYGVKVMSIGFMVKPGQPIIWRGPMLHSAIRQFLGDVDWGKLDYLIIDLPPGTGDAQLSLAQSVPLSGGLIVTLPQQVSLEDASRGLSMFKEMNVPILGVVENMSYLEMPDGTRMDIFGTGGGQKLADSAGVPFMGCIPIDPDVRMGGDNGIPIVISHPDSPAALALTAVAKNLAARVSVIAYKEDQKAEVQAAD
jgi:ATP-binding protein involved in chromosome partitioning